MPAEAIPASAVARPDHAEGAERGLGSATDMACFRLSQGGVLRKNMGYSWVLWEFGKSSAKQSLHVG